MRTAVRGTFFGLAAQVVQLTASLAALVVLARLLDAPAFGLAAASLAVTGVLGACSDLGMNVLIVQRDRLDQRAAAWVSAAAGFTLAGLVWATAPLIARAAPDARGVCELLALGALVLPLHALSSPARARLQRVLRFGALFRLDIAVAATMATVSVALAWHGLGAWSIVAGDVAAAAAALAVGWILAPKHTDGDVAPPLGDGARIVGARLADAGAQHGDKLLVGALLGTSALGFYRFALQHSLALYGRFTAVVEQVALPLFSRNQEHLDEPYLKLTRANALAVLPGAAMLWLFAPQLVAWIYPDRWQPAVPALRALALAIGAAGFNSHPGVLWLARGQMALRLRWSMVNLGALAVLVPTGAWLGGLPGVGYALAVRSLAAAAVAQLFTGVPHRSYVRALLPGVVVAGTILLLGR